MFRGRRTTRTAEVRRARQKPRHSGLPYRAPWRNPFDDNELCGRARLLHEQEHAQVKEPAEQE